MGIWNMGVGASGGSSGGSGTPGRDGVSPIVELTRNDDSVTLKVTDAEGEKTAVIYDGKKGDPGDSGTSGVDCAAYGLPILHLTGDVSTMTKDNAVDLTYVYGDRSGTASVKWQGSSSLSYPKKNYTIKFDNAFEAKEGWGEQKKYCLKANFIDHSHARNVVNAKLWGQIVKSRKQVPVEMTGLPNGGAVDGFPCIVMLNGEFQGLYTFNIPKDGWMFGMGARESEAIVCADSHAVATRFKAPATMNGDFDLEYMYENNTLLTIDKITGLLGQTGNNLSSKISISDGVLTNNESVADSGYCPYNGVTFASGTYRVSFEHYNPNTSEADPRRAVNIGFWSVGENTFAATNVTKAFGYSQDWLSWSGEFTVTKDGAMFYALMGGCAELPRNGNYQFRNLKVEKVVDNDWVKTSLNTLINAAINSDGTDLDTTVAKYLDWQSAIDYYIFVVLLRGGDMTDKNYLLATYDGTKWFFSAYDMDSTYGLMWDGKSIEPATTGVLTSSYADSHRVMELIKTYKADELKARYAEIRKAIMSEDNVAVEFLNFVGAIPTPVFAEDVKRWPTIPSTAASTVHQILNWYRMRVAVIDKEIDSM